MRGPLTADYPVPDLSGNLEEADGILIGAWTFADKLLLGFLDKSKGHLPPWKSPYLRTTEETKLMAPKKMILHVNLTTGTITKTTSEVEEKHIPCRHGARLEDFVYGHAAGPRSTMVEWNGAKMALRPLLRWSGATGKPTVYENAPFSSQDVKAYLNRLWCLAGVWDTEEAWTEGFWNKDAEFMLAQSLPSYEAAQVGDTVTGTGIPAGTKIISKSNPVERLLILDKKITETKANAAFTLARNDKYEANTLFFSDQGGPRTDDINLWKDDASGLVNRIIVGDEDGNDFSVALAVVGQSLLVFKRYSVWALYGYSAATFQVRNLTYDFGCIDPNSVAEENGGVYFASQDGLQFFDGSTFTQVDDKISNTTIPISNEVAGESVDQDAVTYFGQISIDSVGGDYIMASYTKQALTEAGGATKGDLLAPTFVGMMHQKSDNWSEFTTTNLNSTGVPVYLGWGAARPWCYDGDCINPMPKLVNVNEDANVDQIHAPAEAIPAKFWSDRVALASPGYTTQLHRFMLDYTWPNGATDGAAVAGWHIRLWGTKGSAPVGSNTELITQRQVPGHAASTGRGPIDGSTPSLYTHGRRYQIDVFDEAIDAMLEVEWKSSTLAVQDPEVYDAILEYQTARQRRSV